MVGKGRGVERRGGGKQRKGEEKGRGWRGEGGRREV